MAKTTKKVVITVLVQVEEGTMQLDNFLTQVEDALEKASDYNISYHDAQVTDEGLQH